MMRELVFIFCGLFCRIVLSEECGGILQDDSGWITAPDSDGDGFYDNEADCWWVIVAQNNSAIEIAFLQMDLQQNVNCFDDFLEVYDGNQFLAAFCGDHLGPRIVARSDSVILHFQSDWEMSAGGFNISYRQINGFLCGSTEILSIGTYRTLDANGDGFYDHGLFCQWDIKSIQKGSILRLYYTQFDIPENRNCTMDYLLVFSQHQTLGVYCGPYRPPLFITTYPVLSSIFMSGCCVSGKGLSAVYTTQDEHCGDILIKKTGVIKSLDTNNDGFYDNNQNCWWVMVAPHNGIVDLEIQHMAIEYFENCEHDYIWLYDGDITAESSIGWVCGNILPPTVRTSSNRLFLQFYSDEETSDTGFIAQYRHAWPCGSSEETLIGQFGSLDADADGLYEHYVDCVWFIRAINPPKTLQIYVTRFDIPRSLNCSVDYLQIYDDVQSYGVFCGKHVPPLITTTERMLSVEFHTECCLNGEGFTAVYSVQGDCGGILTEETGIIQSHDNDNNGRYDDNANCWWTMVAPPNTVIELEFNRMAIQDHAYCNHDYIQIYDGQAKTEAVFGYYCGYTLPPTLRSTSNVLLLQFVSDSYDNHAGFKAEYKHVSARPCGTIENKFFGTFALLHVDADGFYDSDLNCAWEIHSFNPARMTSFYLTEFDIQASIGCALDYLRVYDEEQTYGTFCGSNKPPLITTSKVVLHIEFRSDCCVNGKGFMAVFVQHDGECGGILIQSAGKLQSFDRDNDGIYDANQNCIWALVAPEDWIVEIIFLSIQIQYEEDCDFDSLQVNDEVLCGNFGKKTYRSEGNLLMLHFYTDSEYEFAGWTAEYRHVINATRRTSLAQLTFPTTLDTVNSDHGISHTASTTSTFSTIAQDTEKITTTDLRQTDKITPNRKASENPHQITNTATDVNSATSTLSDIHTETASLSDIRTATTTDSSPSLHTGSEPSHALVNTLAFFCQILPLSIFIIWQCLHLS